MIVVARTLSVAEAFVMKSALDAEQIVSVVDGQHLTGMIGYTGGPGEIRLKVAEADVERAERILRRGAARGAVLPPPEVRNERNRWRRFVLAYFAIHLIVITIALMA